MRTTYLLPIFAVGLHLGIQVLGCLRLRAAREKIGGRIKSAADLEVVKAAIQTNLRLGVLLMCNLVLMLVSWFVIPGNLRIFYLAPLAVGQTVLWLMGRPVEKQFKTLPVEAGDENLSSEYRSYVEQWSGFEVTLRTRSGHA